MLMAQDKTLHKYDDKELKTLLSSIVVLVDSREKENRHILEGLDSRHIQYQTQGLNYGDYSFMLPMNIELGIVRDMYFNNQIVIERKGSLEELSSNLATYRDRFEAELLRCRGKMILMIEGSSYQDIFYHSYNTKLSEKAFFTSLMSFKARYDIDIEFVDSQFSWYYIYNVFYYYLRNYLKG